MNYTESQTQRVDAVLDDMFSTFEDLDLVFEEIAAEQKSEVAEKTSQQFDRIEYVSKLFPSPCGVNIVANTIYKILKTFRYDNSSFRPLAG